MGEEKKLQIKKTQTFLVTEYKVCIRPKIFSNFSLLSSTLGGGRELLTKMENNYKESTLLCRLVLLLVRCMT